MPPSKKKARVLVQAAVSPSTLKKLNALARTRGCSRASYLRHLVEMHVRAVTPEILRALDESSHYGSREKS
jgi:hypothetical protein